MKTIRKAISALLTCAMFIGFCQSLNADGVQLDEAKAYFHSNSFFSNDAESESGGKGSDAALSTTAYPLWPKLVLGFSITGIMGIIAYISGLPQRAYKTIVAKRLTTTTDIENPINAAVKDHSTVAAIETKSTTTVLDAFLTPVKKKFPKKLEATPVKNTPEFQAASPADKRFVQMIGEKLPEFNSMMKGQKLEIAIVGEDTEGLFAPAEHSNADDIRSMIEDFYGKKVAKLVMDAHSDLGGTPAMERDFGFSFLTPAIAVQ